MTTVPGGFIAMASTGGAAWVSTDAATWRSVDVIVGVPALYLGLLAVNDDHVVAIGGRDDGSGGSVYGAWAGELPPLRD
jgi:hypothetical protein